MALWCVRNQNSGICQGLLQILRSTVSEEREAGNDKKIQSDSASWHLSAQVNALKGNLIVVKCEFIEENYGLSKY